MHHLRAPDVSIITIQIQPGGGPSLWTLGCFVYVLVKDHVIVI